MVPSVTHREVCHKQATLSFIRQDNRTAEQLAPARSAPCETEAPNSRISSTCHYEEHCRKRGGEHAPPPRKKDNLQACACRYFPAIISSKAYSVAFWAMGAMNAAMTAGSTELG